jgi:hypothetical protein
MDPLAAVSPGLRRHQANAGLLDHRFQALVCVMEHEFGVLMLVKDTSDVWLARRGCCHRSSPST